MDERSMILKETWASYFPAVYFVTALVPSDTACLANSPGSSSRTAVWTSLDVMNVIEFELGLGDRSRDSDGEEERGELTSGVIIVATVALTGLSLATALGGAITDPLRRTDGQLGPHVVAVLGEGHAFVILDNTA
ncbi:hypothetical protein TCAL_17162 [Tigriopus californicus]|uniref:Uncharacterized protein n=1 Tax=Tigriopus californicus TaxID=6832 RepID=A0A553P2I6_TIGCA|nr:hypothetical protein TCAL_17162 [Tigriopus californicus]